MDAAVTDVSEMMRHFREHRALLRNQGPDALMFSEGVFAVGLLMGGMWPGAAACVAVMTEDTFPDADLPWDR